MAAGQREIDVAVLGPTGVTGRRTAAYLAERAPAVGARWAPAGRDPDRVRRVLADVGVNDPPEPLIADVSDVASMRELASRARVVLNLVGPYTEHGEAVVEACVAEGAHYVDVTGELGFVRDVITRHHDAARAAGVKVVQVCGFEALPPDLATLRAAELAHARHGDRVREVDVRVYVRSPRGVGPADILSGGTIRSARFVLADPHAGDILDPAVLVPDAAHAERVRRASPLRYAPRIGPRGEAIAPMLPGPFVNPPVIHRTFALLAEEGSELGAPAYREGVAIDGSRATLAPRFAVASALSGFGAGLGLMMRAPAPARKAFAAAFARAPGSSFGPSQRLDEWSWRLELDARTEDGSQVEVRIDADGHPGYLTTATLMGEVGLLLAEDGATPRRAGCLTPATAVGTVSLERFAVAGARFSP